MQLYQSIKSDITTGAIKAGERLPSLRSLSQSLGISITTVQLAYNQLLVEGYTVSRPQSGYYVSQTFHAGPGFSSIADISIAKKFFRRTKMILLIYMTAAALISTNGKNAAQLFLINTPTVYCMKATHKGRKSSGRKSQNISILREA